MQNNNDTASLSAVLAGLLKQWRDTLWQGRTTIRVAETARRHIAEGEQVFHNHLELFFQLAGRNTFSLPDSSFVLKAGEMALVPAGVPHAERAEHGAQPFDMVVIMAGPDWLTFIRAGRAEDGRPFVRDLMSTRSPDYTKVELAIRCCRLYLSDPDTRVTGCGMMAALLGEFIQALEKPGMAMDATGTGGLVTRCQSLLRTYFSSLDCNVAHLAGELGCSPNYLSSRYRAETGQRLSEVLMQMRLERAAFLLSDRTDRVQEVALASGFSDASYFIACFRKRFGETPLAYRAGH